MWSNIAMLSILPQFKATNKSKFHYLHCAIPMLPETEWVVRRQSNSRRGNTRINLLKIPKSQRHSVFWLKFHGLRKKLFEFLKFFVFVLLLQENAFTISEFSKDSSGIAPSRIWLSAYYSFSSRKHRNCTKQIVKFGLAHCFFCSSPQSTLLIALNWGKMESIAILDRMLATWIQ